MRTKITYIAACLLSGFMLPACSNLGVAECDTCGDSYETVAEPYSVSFRLGGSVGAATRAATVSHSEKEKALNSLFAVVFMDADASGISNGTESQEADEDLLFAAFPVDLTNYNSGAATDPHLSFALGEQGSYNICFIANPSGYNATGTHTGLAAKITSLIPGGSTVAQFKALVEEIAPQADGPFLMTSPFYAVTSAYASQAEIATVNLTRAVARVDVVNQADGVTVERLVFHNHASQSRLISDNAGEFNSAYVSAKPYVPESGIIGSSAPDAQDNAYLEQIYTYEQLAGVDDNAYPALEIIYSVPSAGEQLYTHTVKFETPVTEAEGQPTPVALKRNNHYLVTLSNDKGSVRFDLGVKNWDEGDTFELAGSAFASGTQQPAEEPVP